jgi:diguanylate cyclase (GGDEF)-like protein
LPNRALFTDRVTQAISRTMRNSDFLFAVMFLDFDRFKMVNDSLGHSYGDQMLIEISYRLRDCVREIDTVARLGGDEFAVLLEDIDAEDEAEDVARRINKLLGGPFRLADKDIVSNASIGIAFSSLGYSHPEEMIRDADIAMYQAKSQGRARHIVFDKGMHVLAVTQLEIETDLRRAIEEDEFLLYYQPVMNAESEKLSGFEALIRWQHPRRGIVPPGDFIAIAEETRLIIPIGRWVIREACKQARIWQRAFPKLELNISVNIAPQQFTDPNLIDDIRDVLEKTKLPGQRLKVEITESAIMENPHEVAQRLNQIREMGVQLHVDDFGTGYSSLSHLHRFPIDALKVDRSFVISMGESDENMEIVRTIIALAHNLKLKTVAEGVETRGALEQLKKLGCDFAQGYFFSRPMEVSEATKFISENT